MLNRLKYLSCTKLTILSFYFLLAACSNSGQEKDLSVATINGYHFSVPLYTVRYQQFLRQTELQDNLRLRHIFLQSLIDEHLLLKWADSSGFLQDPFHQDNLHALKEQLLLNALYERKILPRTEASEEFLRKIYRWSKSKIHVRHLYTENANKAQDLFDRLQKGESWKELAREIFKDPILAGNGGDLGFFQLGDMDPSFEVAAFQLSDGEISQPVKTHSGFSIIQVIEREIDPFVLEDEFQRNRWKFTQYARNYQRLPALQAYTDSVAASLNIYFKQGTLNSLWKQWPKLITTELEYSPLAVEEKCVSFGSPLQTWTTEQTIAKLKTLSNRQKNMIITPQKLKDAVIGLIIQEQSLAEARGMGLNKDDLLLQAYEQVKRSYIISAIMDQIHENAHLSDELAASYFAENSDEFITESRYETAEIIVEDETKANELFGMIAAGADFGDLAKEHSLRKATAVHSGYVGWGTAEQYGSLHTSLKEVRPGDLIGPIDLAGLYILLKVLDVEPPRLLTYQEALPRIEKALKAQINREAFVTFRDNLKNNSDISIDSTLVKELNLNEVTS